MKIAVINFSGNVGKTTVAKHLLLPRIRGAALISVESINSGDGDGAGPALRGRQFGALQEYLQTVDSAIVDIGASNVEELVALMRKYRGSQEDFDCFIVPTVPAIKQQKDTIATLIELASLGVPPTRLKLVFNMVEDAADVRQAFDVLLDFVGERGLASANTNCRLSANEVFARIRGTESDLTALAADGTDYKREIAEADDTGRKLALAQRLATRRLALGILPELDACFEALDLASIAGSEPEAMP